MMAEEPQPKKWKGGEEQERSADDAMTGFLCGSDFTVADACLWAATHDPSLSLPSNIKKWAERMSHLPQTAAVDAMVISA